MQIKQIFGMYKFLIKIFLLIVIIFSYGDTFSQIVINGPRPQNLYHGSGGGLAVSISYGYILWKDSKQRDFSGSSASLVNYRFLEDVISIQKLNYSTGFFLGGEKMFTDAFTVKAHVYYSKMHAGISARSDIESVDKSKFTQLAFYSSLNLTKDQSKRFQFQWLAGPEILYAQKNVLIKEYVEDENSIPEDYHYKESVLEVAIVTGLGLSFRITDNFSLFSDGLIGISLPGKGLKITSNNIGIKYVFN